MDLKSKSRIFGSPPGKMFTLSKEMYNHNVWEKQIREWIKVLVSENEKLKKEAFKESGHTFSLSTKLLFISSRNLGLSHHAKFLASDIYQRFCVLHVQLMSKYVSDGGAGEEDPKAFMVRVQQKMGRQAPLRVFSCLWIAAKIICGQGVITRECVQKLLKHCGFDISLKAINKSEIRILEQIKYNCWYCSTLPEYISLLVGFVGTIPDSQNRTVVVGVEIDNLYLTAIKVLEYVYLNYEDIYADLFFKVTGSRSISEKHKSVFAVVKCDRMLLATSVVASAGWINGHTALCSSFVGSLSPVTSIPAEDVNVLVSCILKRVIKIISVKGKL